MKLNKTHISLLKRALKAIKENKEAYICNALHNAAAKTHSPGHEYISADQLQSRIQDLLGESCILNSWYAKEGYYKFNTKYYWWNDPTFKDLAVV